MRQLCEKLLKIYEKEANYNSYKKYNIIIHVRFGKLNLTENDLNEVRRKNHEKD